MSMNNAADLFRFLATHQPLPPDAEWDDALLASVGEVRRHLEKHPDDSAIPLFLGLMGLIGEGSGFGHYQIFDEVLRAHTEAVVVDALRECLRSSSASRRYWCVEYCAGGYATHLLGDLEVFLDDRDEGTRFQAIQSIQTAQNGEALAMLERARGRAVDDETRSRIDDSIAIVGGYLASLGA